MAVVGELMKYALKPENPLQILQGGLEIEIQLVVQTLHVYTVHYLRLPGGELVRMSDLGYEMRLCNMALVSAAATWDGFKGNIVRAVRTSGHTFSERQLCENLKQTTRYNDIQEPLARRHCIVHNLAKVDQDYKRDVPSSTLCVGDPLNTDLSYLKDASAAFFDTGVELVKRLVADGLLPHGQQETIGEFQRDPGIALDSILSQSFTGARSGKETTTIEDIEYATLVQVGELEAKIPDMTSKEVALSVTEGLGRLVHKVTQAIKTLEGGGWEIVSHEITVISRHLIVSFLVKRRKIS
jgi:hypothetical protein